MPQEVPPSSQHTVQAAGTVEQPDGPTHTAERASAAEQPQSRQQAAEAASFAEQLQSRAAQARDPPQGGMAAVATATLPPPTPETPAASPARAVQGHSNGPASASASDAEGSSPQAELSVLQLCAAAWPAQPSRALLMRQRPAQLQHRTFTATACTPGDHLRRLMCSLQALLPALGGSRSLAIQEMAVELQERIICQNATDRQLLSLWRHCAEAMQAASTGPVAALHGQAGFEAAGSPAMGSACSDVGSVPHAVEAVSSIPALRSTFADAELDSDDEFAAQASRVIVSQSGSPASRLRRGTLACAGRQKPVQLPSSMPSELDLRLSELSLRLSELDLSEPFNSQRLEQGTGVASVVRNTSVHSVMPPLANLLASADPLAWSVSSGELPDDMTTEL